MAISFLAADGASTKTQHAIIRVAVESGRLRYTSGRLGPRPSLWEMLEEISARLGPPGLDLENAAPAPAPKPAVPTEWPDAELDAAVPSSAEDIVVMEISSTRAEEASPPRRAPRKHPI